jgi:hypothetical protein
MRLKRHEREKLKQLVADSILNRFTPDETLHYIENNIHIRISLRYMEQVKAWLKADQQKQFLQLRKDKHAYILQYLDRINEIRDLQRYQRLLMLKTTSDFLRHRCAIELHALTLSLANLYDVLPAITERSYFSEGILSPDHEVVREETQQQQPQEDTAIPESTDRRPDTP